jgi:glycosyltransferase involved in cell wall biosynthesis
MKPLVSVITSCYNSSNFVSQSIESVINQTYRNWELIIVDDCSTDSSVEIIKNFIRKDNRIKLFLLSKNSGSPVKPRNTGIRNAQGRYIAFLDSDDIWLPTKLEKQLLFFDDDQTAIVFSYYEKITEMGERNNRIIFSPKMVTYKKLLQGDCIGFLSAMYDTQKTGEVTFPEINCEDYAFWLIILSHCCPV